MKKSQKIIITVLVILILVVLAYRVYTINNVNMRATLNAVVMKVGQNSLSVMDIEDKDLLRVSFADEGNIGFKEGQEVLIYFDGSINLTYPGQIYNVGKIKIEKEKSEVEIPESVLRYYNSSLKNVEVTLNKLNKTEISFTIKDENEYPYGYQDTYKIEQKKIKKTQVEGTIQTHPESNNSVPPYIPPYTEHYTEYYEELPKKSEIKSEDTGTFEKIDKYTVKKTYNWINLYGELEERRIPICTTSFIWT